MNIVSGKQQFDFSKVSHLFEWEPLFVEKTPRDYQIQILRKTIRDMSQWLVEWRWDIATAWWKSAMALSLSQHVVKRGGRILYLTAWNTELRNAIRKHKSYWLWDNYIQIRGEEWIEKLLQNSHPHIYTTTQMLIYNERYKYIDPEYFDLIIIDESQDFFWDTFSLPLFHFHCPKVYASATPFTITHHLGERVPHVYWEVTSKELEERYGFPKKKIRNYYVQDFHDPNVQNPTRSEFDFESEKSHRLLNIGRRFTLLEWILEEVIQRGGKILPFMTSVRDAEDFVRFVVPSNPILRWKVDFTAGIRGTDKNDELEQQLRDGEIQALLSKDILNTALDVPDITDVVFTAPSLSLQKMIQRIGRAARPYAWKEYFTVHDMISSVFHSWKYQWKNKAIRTSQLHKLESDNRSRFLWKYWERTAYYDVILPEGVSDKEWFSYTEVEIGEVEHLIFLWDKKITRDIFATFARDVFGVSYKELFDNISIYRDKVETMMVVWRENRIPITFQELLVASEFFGTLDYCKNYDYLWELYAVTQNRPDKNITPLVFERNSRITEDTQIEIFTPSLEEQKAQVLKKLFEDIGIKIFETWDQNFEICFDEKIIQSFEKWFTNLSKEVIKRTRSILTWEIPKAFEGEIVKQIWVNLSWKDDMETMILSFISQVPDPQDMFICSDFIIEICQILTLYSQNRLALDYEFRLNPRLGAKFLAMINPNKSENLRDKDFNIVKTTKENDVFLSIDNDIYYVMSRGWFVHAYKLVRDLEWKQYYLCLNDNAVEIMRIWEVPKSWITQTIRFFDKQWENAIWLHKMFELQKITIKPWKNNPEKSKNSFSAKRIAGRYVSCTPSQKVLHIFDGDQVTLHNAHPRFFYITSYFS